MVLRIVFAVILAAGFVYGWNRLDHIPILVVGQPTSVGPIQSELEAPFFKNLAANTGLPITVTYQSNDELGLKDTFQLKLLRTGSLDLVSLRMPQNVATEPTLLGLDLVGFTTDVSKARAAAQAYSPIVDARIDDKYHAKLLGVWSFGPQVIFCGKPVTKLADLAGLRIRVPNDTFAPMLRSVGALPMVIPFEDVQSNLQNGAVDCAISSAASGYSAGWADYSTHLYLLTLEFGVNAYVISDKIWDKLTGPQQRVLTDAFARHVDNIWDEAKRLDGQATACLTGGPCQLGPPRHLIATVPSASDTAVVAQRFDDVTFREWAARCDAVNPGCADRWRAAVGPVVSAKPGK